MATLAINGVTVEEQGEGDDVVFCIHGLGGSSNNWTPVLPAFGDRRVIRLDLPGSARSPLPARALSIRSYVTACLDVFEQLRVASAHVVAHSMGTVIAQHLAVDHPHLVRSLALFGPLSAPPDAARTALADRAALARKGTSGMQEIADAVVKGATSAETKEQRPVAVALIRESLMRQTGEGYAQSCLALSEAQPAAIETLAVPALLVTGSEDGVGTPAGVEALGARIADASVLVIPHCGHWTTYEKPFECREALTGFYQTH